MAVFQAVDFVTEVTQTTMLVLRNGKPLLTAEREERPLGSFVVGTAIGVEAKSVDNNARMAVGVNRLLQTALPSL